MLGGGIEYSPGSKGRGPFSREACASMYQGGQPLIGQLAQVTPDDLPPYWMRDALAVPPGTGCDCC